VRGGAGVTYLEAVYASSYVADALLLGVFLGIVAVSLRAFWKPLV
jgi:hypothetical protein